MPIVSRRFEPAPPWSHPAYKPAPCDTESPYDLRLSAFCTEANTVAIIRITSHRFEFPLDANTCVAIYVHAREIIETSDPCVPFVTDEGYVYDENGNQIWVPPENWPPVAEDENEQPAGDGESDSGEEATGNEEAAIPDPEAQIQEYLDELLGGTGPVEGPCAGRPPQLTATYRCVRGKWVIDLNGSATWARRLPNGGCEQVEIPINVSMPTAKPCDPLDPPPIGDWRSFLKVALAEEAALEESHGFVPRPERGSHAALPVGHEKEVAPRYRAAVEAILRKERNAGTEHLGKPRVVYVQTLDGSRLDAKRLAQKSSPEKPGLVVRIAGSLFSHSLVDVRRGKKLGPTHPPAEQP